MKRRYLLCIACLCSLAIADSGLAQGYLSSVTYNVSFPLDDTKTFVGNTSWRGVAIEGRRFLQNNVSVGTSAAWHVFDERSADLLSLDPQDVLGNIQADGNALDISGTQMRYVNAFPLQVTGHFYFGSWQSFLGYVGTGAGAYYVKRRFDMGISSITDNSWQFGFAPEVGVVIPMGDGGFLINAKYHYAFKSGDSPALSYVGLGIGLAFAR